MTLGVWFRTYVFYPVSLSRAVKRWMAFTKPRFGKTFAKLGTVDRGDHLNLSGAERVTEYLGRFLSDHFRLADHRADAAYDGWEKESREYEKKASEGLSKIRKGE